VLLREWNEVKKFSARVRRSAGEGQARHAGRSHCWRRWLPTCHALRPRFLRNNGYFCEAAPRNHDFMRRTKIPAHGILNSHISEAKTITD
jgi:hypothetical protein